MSSQNFQQYLNLSINEAFVDTQVKIDYFETSPNIFWIFNDCEQELKSVLNNACANICGTLKS